MLAGLLANAGFGLWWLDPVIALGIGALVVREGREAWQGEGCACAAIPGLENDGCLETPEQRQLPTHPQ